MRRCLAWAYHYVLTITVVLLSSDVELINSLVKVFEEDTSGSVIRRIALNHRCTRIVVEHLDVRTLNVGLFAVLVAVDGILVLNLHTQGTLGLTHHLHIEIYGDAAAIFAVDCDVTFLEDVYSEVTRIEAQHHGGTVAVLHRGHVGRRNEAYKTIQSRWQRYADASRLALSAVGQRDGICAARALRNGRSDAVRICYELRLVQSRVVVCLHHKHCSFVGVEDNSDAVPVLAAGHFHRREPVAHGVGGISRELRQLVHFEVVVLRIARQRGTDIVQGLCGEVADEEISLIWFVLEHFVLDIAVADALHSIYIKRGHAVGTCFTWVADSYDEEAAVNFGAFIDDAEASALIRRALELCPLVVEYNVWLHGDAVCGSPANGGGCARKRDSLVVLIYGLVGSDGEGV